MKEIYPNINFHVVLVHPQIPNNTGNIGRLCVASFSRLHLIHPLGFEITDSRVKRAGLDYWPELELEEHSSLEDCSVIHENPSRCFFFSAHGERSLYDIDLQEGDVFLFGKEAEGFDAEIKSKYADRLIKIPFPGKVRSFNLANSVAMVLGEGLRQVST